MRPTEVVRLTAGQVEYRLEQRGKAAVLIFHGGHMRAGLALGEEVFETAGHTVLAPSRPGYGRTSLDTGPSPDAFADSVAELCERLDIDRIAAAVGISAGGPTAVAMAVRHPQLVERLILQSAVGPLPWPDRRTRALGRVLFSPRMEPLTWRMMHSLLRKTPALGLRMLLRDLTTRPVGDVLAALGEHRKSLIELLVQMRSGAGFANDLRYLAHPATTYSAVTQPTLVIASRADGSVPYAQAEALADRIRGARLLTSGADSHFIWFGTDYPKVAQRITDFLA